MRAAAICVDAIATEIPSKTRSRHSTTRRSSDLSSISLSYPRRLNDASRRANAFAFGNLCMKTASTRA